MIQRQIAGRSAREMRTPPAPGKWSVQIILHPTIGEISIGELMYEMAFHDLGHLKQILEIKRYALYPRIGNMQKFYKLQ